MAGSRKSDLRGKQGTQMGSGVVAWVSTVRTVSLLSLLLLLSLVSLLLLRLCRRCLWGRFRGARLVGRWMMLSLLAPLSFYPPAGVSHDIFLSVVQHTHCLLVPRCYHF